MTNAEVTATVTHIVRDTHTAIALGSGNVPALATPMLVAWCEQATIAALELTGGSEDSVGIHVDLRHVAATGIGAHVTARATLTSRTESRVVFEVTASDGDKTLAEGTIERAIVDRDRFLSGLKKSV